jgi:nucleoside-diphosphate kinase
MSKKEAHVVAFVVEWLDRASSLVRVFRLNHFVDGTIELINSVTNVCFLKRMYFSDISRIDLVIGASINLNSRQLTLRDYADEGTRKYFNSTTTRFCCLITPEEVETGSIGQNISRIANATGKINRMKMIEVDARLSTKFACSRGRGVALEGFIWGGTEGFLELLASHRGVTGSFGDAAESDARSCFDAPAPTASALVTACLIKPHIIKGQSLGACIKEIAELGFSVEALEMASLDQTSASNFFDVYKGTLPQYERLLFSMVEGPCVFVMVGGGQDVVESFREACGPVDPNVAKILRPKSLRARFGVDMVRNFRIQTNKVTK